MSVMNLKQSTRQSPDNCTVYWDYENMPIPKQSNLTEILSTLKDKLWRLIGTELPIEYKVYIRASKITEHIHNDFDINAITLIHVPSTKPEAVDKRLMIDMMFSLYELERDNKSRAIALISGDKDFGNLLSKIHHTPPISNSFLILLRRSHIDYNLSNVVDHVIQLNCGEHKASSKKAIKSIKPITLNIIHLLDKKNQFEFKGRSLTQIRAIKDVIYTKMDNKSVNKQQLILFFKDGVLNDSESFKKYGISDGDTLHWIFDKNNLIKHKNNQIKTEKKTGNKKKIRLKFQNLNSNQSFEATTKRTNSIKTLKINAYNCIKHLNIVCKKEHLVLFYEDKQLNDDKKIRHYNIKDGDTVIWYTDDLKAKSKPNSEKKKGKPKIKITFHHKGLLFDDFVIESTVLNFVNNLRNKLSYTFGVHEQGINIMHKEQILNGKKMLKQCGITKDVVLVWSHENKVENKKDVNGHGKLMENDEGVFDPFGFEHDIVPGLINDNIDDNMDMNKMKLMDEGFDIKHDEEEWITVIVKNEMNATVLFTMNKKNSILDLKKMIKPKLCIDPQDQILSFNGVALNDCDDGSVLSNNGTIDLRVSVNGISMDIEVLGGDIIKALCFGNNRSILDLKKEISNRCGLNANYQILKYNDNEMEDSYCLYNYGISNGSLIKLTVRE